MFKKKKRTWIKYSQCLLYWMWLMAQWSYMNDAGLRRELKEEGFKYKWSELHTFFLNNCNPLQTFWTIQSVKQPCSLFVQQRFEAVRLTTTCGPRHISEAKMKATPANRVKDESNAQTDFHPRTLDWPFLHFRWLGQWPHTSAPPTNPKGPSPSEPSPFAEPHFFQETV